MTSPVQQLKQILNNEGSYKNLSGLIDKVPLKSFSEADKIDWLNRVMQVGVVKFGLALVEDMSAVTQLFYITIKYTYSTTKLPVVIVESTGRSKAMARLMAANTLIMIYDKKLTSLEEPPTMFLAGDATAVGAPTAAVLTRTNEQPEDTTVLALTNPQDSNRELDDVPKSDSIVAVPVPLDVSEFRQFSHSVPDHEYSTMQERHHFFGKGTLATTDSFGSIISLQTGSVTGAMGIWIPSDLLGVEGSVGATPYLNHVFNATAVEFTIKVNPAPNQAGLYAFTHTPAPEQTGNITGKDGVLQNVWLHPNCLYQRFGLELPTLNLGVQNDLKYVVPYDMPSNYVCTELSEDPLSMIRDSALFSCICISPLRTGDTESQSLDFTIWYRFLGTRLNGMRYDVTPTSAMLNQSEEIRHEEPTMFLAGGGLSTAVGDIWNFVESIPIIGSVADTIGNVVGEFAVGADQLILGKDHADKFHDNLSAVGVTNDRGKDKGKGGSLLRSASALTAPAPTRAPPLPEIKMAPTSNPCLSNTGDHLYSQRLGLHPNIQTMDIDHQRPMISDYAKRPNLLKIIPITTAMARGEILVKLNLGLLNDPALYNTSRMETLHYGPLGAIAATFENYVGKKIYAFQVVKTAFHKLSLAVSGTPYTVVPDNTEAGSQYFKVLDFNDLDTAKYDTPYIDRYFMKTSPLSTELVSIKPGGTPVSGNEYFVTAVPFNGEIAIILTNELRVIGAQGAPIVSSTVDLLIWEYMDDGFQAFLPTDVKASQWNYSTMSPPEPSAVIKKVPVIPPSEGLYLAGEPVQNFEKEPRNFGSFASAGPQVQTSDVHEDLYSLLNRFTTPLDIESTSIDIPLTPRAAAKFTEAFVATEGAAIPTWAWVWVSPYMYFTGSFDFLIVPYDDTGNVVSTNPQFVTYLPPRYVARGPSPAAIVGGTRTLTPAYMNGNFMTVWSPQVNPNFLISTGQYVKANKIFIHASLHAETQRIYPDDNRTKSNGTLRITPDNRKNIKYKIFPRCAKDFRLHTFMGFFPMKLSNQELSPMKRSMVIDGRKSDFRRVTPRSLAKMVGTTEVILEFSYQKQKITQPPPFAPILVNTKDPTTSGSKTYTQNFDSLSNQLSGLSLGNEGRRTDHNIRLLASGIESNPGPVWSQPIQDFKSTLTSGLNKATNLVFSPVTDPLNHISSVIDETAADVKNATNEVGSAATSINKLSTRVDDMIGSVQDTVKTLFDTISSITLVPDPSKLWQALLHFVHAIVSPIKTTIGISIVGIFSALGLIPLSMITVAGTVFGGIISSRFSSPEVQVEPENKPTVDTDGTPVVNLHLAGEEDAGYVHLGGFIISCVSHLLGYTLSGKENKTSLLSSYATSMPKIFTMTTHVVHFLKGTLELFKKAFHWVVSKLPGGEGIKYISNNKELIEKFVDEAQKMVDPVNREAITTQPRFRSTFWTTYMVACFLSKLSSTNTELKFPPQLNSLIVQVMKLADEISVQLMCCPVRYEPFVVYCVGDSAIGKSYMSNTVVVDMLKNIDYRGYDNPIYVRTPGNQYWNGCVSQPCVMYDDYMAVGGPQFGDIQLAELFALKTTAIFNPPMADLSEKRLRYNPLMVWMNSNVAFPEGSGIKCQEAVWRRRDVLISARLKEQYKNINLRDLSPNDKKFFSHLEFCFYKDPKNRHEILDDWMGYEDMVQKIKGIHSQYHLQEQENVKIRLENLQKLLPEQAARIPQGVDPFTLFYEAQMQAAEISPVQTGLLPSEALQVAIENNPSIVSKVRKLGEYIFKLNKGMSENQTDIPITLDAAGNSQQTEINTDLQGEAFDDLPYDLQGRQHEIDRSTAPPLAIIGDTAIRQKCEDLKHLSSWKADQSRVWSGIPGPSLFVNVGQWISSKVNYSSVVIHDKLIGWTHGCSITNGHVMQCSVCHSRKLCQYRCSNPIVHPYCAECYEQMDWRTCSMNDGHPILKWYSPSDHEISFSRRMVALLVEYVIRGQCEFQRMLNWLSSNSIWIDLTSLILFSVSLAVYDLMNSYEQYKILNEAINSWNELHGTNYRLVSRTYNGQTHYFASDASRLNTLFFSGDPEPSSSGPAEDGVFLDSYDPDNFLIKKVMNGVEFEQQCSLEGLEFKVLSQQPSRCPHSRVRPNWEYIRAGDNSYWVSPDMDEDFVPDQQCPKNCCWSTIVEYKAFLVSWALKHYDEIFYERKPRHFNQGNLGVVPQIFLQSEIQPKPKSWLSKFLSYLNPKEWYLWISDKVRQYATLLKVGLTVISVISGATFLWNLSKPSLLPSGSYSSGSTVVARANSSARPTIVVPLAGEAEHTNKISLLHKNVAFLSCDYTTKPGYSITVRGIFIRGRHFLMTFHQYNMLLREEKAGSVLKLVTVRNNYKEHKVSLLGCKGLQLPGYDLVSVEFSPTHVGEFKSIIPFSVKSDKISNVKSKALVMQSKLSKEPILELKNVGITSAHGRTNTINPETNETQVFEGVYIYKGFSGRNTCGSLLLSYDNNTPLMGFHYAADREEDCWGAAIPLCQQALINLSPSASDAHDLTGVKEDSETHHSVMSLAGSYEHHGWIDKRLVPFQATSTKIRPSLVSEELKVDYPVKTEPAILTQRDSRWTHPVSPLISGCNKHCNPHDDYPSDIQQIVVEHALNQLVTFAIPIYKVVKVRSVREVVCGIPGDPRYPPLEMKTSVGWPFTSWKRDKKMATRESLLQPIRDSQEMMVDIKLDQEFQQLLEFKQQQRRQNIVPLTVFWDHLKDERRKPEKARSLGGTRIFSLSPLDFLIQYKQYYLDFIAAWHANWHDLQHAVGIACDGPDWSYLAITLQSNGSKIVCLDYSDFGPRMNSNLSFQIERNFAEWYKLLSEDLPESEFDPEDDQIRKIMSLEICSPKHLCQDLVYSTYAGIPSGHPATTLLNTEVNKAKVKIAWLGLAPPEYKQIDNFRKHVCLYAYGDDVILSVSDEICEWFNGETISNWFAQFGVKCTSAKKDKTICKWTTIEEATFLKRGFKKHPKRPGQWLAPLDEISIRETAHWVHVGNTDIEGTQVNLDQSLRLAYSQGPEFFQNWKNTLNKVIRRVGRGLQPLDLSWDLLDKDFFQD